jgi:hypothetical protein
VPTVCETPPVYIRSKVAKGRTYYQLVEGRREGGKVRQRIVAALGRHPTIEDALADLKRQLTRLRRQRNRLDMPNPSKAHGAWLARQDANIAKLAQRVALLTEVLKQGIVAPARPVVPTNDTVPGPSGDTQTGR